MEIIVINGYPESGKDTFVNLCKNIVGESFVKNISTVDFVKEVAMLCGWDGTKTPKNRKFLSDLNHIKQKIKELFLFIVESQKRFLDLRKN